MKIKWYIRSSGETSFKPTISFYGSSPKFWTSFEKIIKNNNNEINKEDLTNNDNINLDYLR